MFEYKTFEDIGVIFIILKKQYIVKFEGRNLIMTEI